MDIYLDTAIIDEIREASEMGMCDGVTTNPTLAAKANKPYVENIREICSIVKGPVSAEVIAADKEGMVKQAMELAAISDNIVVKIPMTAEGLKAVSALKEKGIKSNVTLVFTPSQALLAAKAGAFIVSPFVGRLDDISSDGMRLIDDILSIYDNYGFETKLLVASVRHPMHVVEAAMMGADIATIPFAVLKKLVEHPLTDKGIKRFNEDWEKLPKKFRPF